MSTQKYADTLTHIEEAESLLNQILGCCGLFGFMLFCFVFMSPEILRFLLPEKKILFSFKIYTFTSSSVCGSMSVLIVLCPISSHPSGKDL